MKMRTLRNCQRASSFSCLLLDILREQNSANCLLCSACSSCVEWDMTSPSVLTRCTLTVLSATFSALTDLVNDTSLPPNCNNKDTSEHPVQAESNENTKVTCATTTTTLIYILNTHTNNTLSSMINSSPCDDAAVWPDKFIIVMKSLKIPLPKYLPYAVLDMLLKI